jgi:type IV pilus assembly protein PilA
MQLKEKPELHQINQKSEALVKTYQPDRPIKERKSVARVDRTNLQPIKERKSVAKVDRTNLQPLKEPKSMATTLLKIILIYFPLGILRILFSKFSVVSMIITILSAIILPSFMFCGTQTRAARARQYIDSMNRAQQAKYAENGSFSNSLNALGFVIETDIENSRNHKYSIAATKNAAFSYAVKENLTSYVGAVFLVPVSPASNNEMTTVSILCTANSSRNTQPPNPILQNGVPVCAAGTKSEAHQYVSLMNGSQEFHLQSRGGFSYFFSHLIPGSNQTINYNYSVSATENAAFSYGVSRSNYFHSYVGAVFLVPVSSAANNERTLVPVSRAANNDKTTVSILCVANSPGKIQLPNPIVQNNVPVCAAGSSEVPK